MRTRKIICIILATSIATQATAINFSFLKTVSLFPTNDKNKAHVLPTALRPSNLQKSVLGLFNHTKRIYKKNKKGFIAATLATGIAAITGVAFYIKKTSVPQENLSFAENAQDLLLSKVGLFAGIGLLSAAAITLLLKKVLGNGNDDDNDARKINKIIELTKQNPLIAVYDLKKLGYSDDLIDKAGHKITAEQKQAIRLEIKNDPDIKDEELEQAGYRRSLIQAVREELAYDDDDDEEIEEEGEEDEDESDDEQDEQNQTPVDQKLQREKEKLERIQREQERAKKAKEKIEHARKKRQEFLRSLKSEHKEFICFLQKEQEELKRFTQKQEAKRLEQERIKHEKQELEAKRLECERIKREKQEQEAKRLEQERIQKEQEAQKLEQEQEEQKRREERINTIKQLRKNRKSKRKKRRKKNTPKKLQSVWDNAPDWSEILQRNNKKIEKKLQNGKIDIHNLVSKGKQKNLFNNL